MLRGKLQFLIVLGVIFSSLVGLLDVKTQTFAETSSNVLIDEPFLNVSYDTEQTEEGNVFRVNLKREADGEQKESRLKLKLLTESNEVIEYPMVNGMEKKDDWFIEKEFTSSAKYVLKVVLPKKEKKLQLFIELNEQSLNNQTKEKSTKESNTDVLGLTEPLVLEMGKTENSKSSKKSASSSSANQEAPVTANSFSLYSDQNSQSQLAGVSAARSSRNLVHENFYTNKVPSYKTDNGKYPEYSWQPTGQTNVINHQGGNESAAGWDGLTSWNVQGDDRTNSYIHYGDASNPNLSLRKLAMETNKKDEFDVRLNVRGNYNYKPGVDIVFLLDNSGSMTTKKKSDAVASIEKLITEVKKIHVPDADNIRMGAHVFSDYLPGSPDATVAISGQESAWDNIVNQYRNLTPSGGTFTERALMVGKDVLDAADPDGTDGRKKLMFILTDGAPNLSFYPTGAVTDSSMYFDQVYITKNSGKYPEGDPNAGKYRSGDQLGNWEYSVGLKEPWPVGSLKITSHITTTNSTARNLKDAGVEIHSLALDIGPTATEYRHAKADMIKGLYKMSSKKANATGETQNDYFFYETDNSEELTEYTKNWYHTILRTVDAGKINFSIGNMVELISTPVASSVGETSVELPTVTSSNGKIEVSNINLFGGQEIQLDYKVRLKTEDASFVSGRWYPVSTDFVELTPTPTRTTDLLYFGIPSVRAVNEDFVIPVKKVWSNDSEDYWQKRQEITAVLQRKNGNEWTNVHQVKLNAGNNWTADFPAVVGKTDIDYRVIEKVGNLDKVPGYAKPEYSKTSFSSNNLGTNGIVITNRLMTTDYTFTKLKEDGTAFTRTNKPEFTIEDTKGNKLTGIKPNDAGLVKIEGLPIGTYTVSESVVPTGYKKMADFTIVVTEKADGTGVVAKVNGKEESITVINELKEIVIPVEKKWVDERDGTANFWKLRQTITAVLQKKDGENWIDLYQVSLNATNSWKNSFPAVDRDSNITYRVIERVGNVEKVSGYEKPSYSQTSFQSATLDAKGILITNKLMTTDYSFKKVMENNQPFFGDSLPKFKLTETTKNIEVIDNVAPDASGIVEFKDLPIGTYRVSETFVPEGFKKMDDFTFSVTEKADGTAVIADSTNKTVVNKLNEFKLKVIKTNEQGAEIEGAVFRLRNLSGTYNKTISSGSTFTFTGLKSELYFLKEVTAPDSYVGLEKEIAVDIFESGHVGVESHPLVTSSTKLGETENVITLKVKNRRQTGVLPRTGSFGNRYFVLFSIICLVAGSGLGAVYLYINRRRD